MRSKNPIVCPQSITGTDSPQETLAECSGRLTRKQLHPAGSGQDNGEYGIVQTSDTAPPAAGSLSRWSTTLIGHRDQPRPHETDALNIPAGVPVLGIVRTHYADARPVETADILVPGDRYEITWRTPATDPRLRLR
jgi:hypothetical protein